jgi:beta-galactosidase
MNRREFVKSGTATVAALAAASALPLAAQSSSTGRLVYPLNRNWRFSAERRPNDTLPSFDDSSFERVAVPHCNRMLPWHSFNDSLYEFRSIYRRSFRLPPEARGRHVFVDFDGAMTASTVWINGNKLGEYRGGYTPFAFDLTPHIDWSGPNLLAVELDSTERPDIPPFGGEIDYLTFGGIYRDVRLRVVPSTYIENIFVHCENPLATKPTIRVSTFISDLASRPRDLILEAELRDGERVVARASNRLAAAAQQTQSAAEELEFGELLGAITP